MLRRASPVSDVEYATREWLDGRGNSSYCNTHTSAKMKRNIIWRVAHWRRRTEIVHTYTHSYTPPVDVVSGKLKIAATKRDAGFFFCESSVYGQVSNWATSLARLRLFGSTNLKDCQAWHTVLTYICKLSCWIRPGKRVRQSYKLKFDVLMVEKIARQSDMTFKAQGVGNH